MVRAKLLRSRLACWSCALLLLVGGCSANSGRLQNILTLQGESWERTYTLEVEDGKMELELGIGLEQGSISWSLKDPAGQEEWAGRATPESRVHETRLFRDSARGLWTLQVQAAEARGSLVVDWRDE